MRVYSLFFALFCCLTLLLTCRQGIAADSISVTNPDFFIDVTNKSNLRIEVTKYGYVNTLEIKYGLIDVLGNHVPSSKLPLSKWDISFMDSWAVDYTDVEREAVKFSIGAYIPVGFSGFYYEFVNGTATNPSHANILEYYPDYAGFFNNKKYHILLTDLFMNYPQTKVMGNKVIIGQLKSGFYYVFDPEILGNGIPTDCEMSLFQSYNTTSINPNDILKMGCRASWGGDCKIRRLEWQDNTSAWAYIPASDGDVDCFGATCYRTSVSSGTWYYQYPQCESEQSSEYLFWLRCNLSYYNHLSVNIKIQTNPRKISCWRYCCCEGGGFPCGWENSNCTGDFVYMGTNINNGACPSTTTSTTTTTTATTTTLPEAIPIKTTWLFPCFKEALKWQNLYSCYFYY